MRLSRSLCLSLFPPATRFGFVFISEPEFQATDITRKGPEILSSVSVPVTGLMPDFERLESINYRITLPEDTEFDINKDRQKYDNSILSVELESLPAGDAIPCIDKKEALESTAYIQAKAKPVKDLSHSLVIDAENGMEKVRVLAEWVYENIEKRPVLSIPDALTIAAESVSFN